MAIPGYQEFMLPLLKIAADGQTRSVSDAMDLLAARLQISEEDREALLPSGQTRYYNRVTWAITYLSKSLLIEKPQRGLFKIAPRGVETLRKNPQRIDNAFLDQFPEYQVFKSKRAEKAAGTLHTSENAGVMHSETAPEAETPDERLDAAYRELRNSLAADLLEKVRTVSPRFFEHLVVDVLVAMGYGGSRADAAQVIGKSGDGGIDGTIKEDQLGLDMVYVQAKRVEKSIGGDVIRQFAGSLGENRAHKGVFITAGSFTPAAREAASKATTRIVLIDGDRLAQYMIDYGVGVAEHRAYHVKKLDNDYFESVV